MDRQAFRDWLSARWDQSVGYSCDVFYCPLANWQRDVQRVECWVGHCSYGVWGDDPTEEALPMWAAAFALAFDQTLRSGSWATGEQALDILDRIEVA